MSPSDMCLQSDSLNALLSAHVPINCISKTRLLAIYIYIYTFTVVVGVLPRRSTLGVIKITQFACCLPQTHTDWGLYKEDSPTIYPCVSPTHQSHGRIYCNAVKGRPYCLCVVFIGKCLDALKAVHFGLALS